MYFIKLNENWTWFLQILHFIFTKYSLSCHPKKLNAESRARGERPKLMSLVEKVHNLLEGN